MKKVFEVKEGFRRPLTEKQGEILVTVGQTVADIRILIDVDKLAQTLGAKALASRTRMVELHDDAITVIVTNVKQV